MTAKYGNQPLFPLTIPITEVCIGRLTRQPFFYKFKDALGRRKMRARALMLCAFTLNATAIWTAKLLTRGTFSMRTQRAFFRKRWRQHPSEWGKTAKSCFARALCGYDIGKDGVCVDRHLERTAHVPIDAETQWREWFRLYEAMYGPGEAMACIQWHVEVLDWIALQRSRPVAWK